MKLLEGKRCRVTEAGNEHPIAVGCRHAFQKAAGGVIGSRVPIMPTGRADRKLARLSSCAVAKLYHHHRLRAHEAEVGAWWM